MKIALVTPYYFPVLGGYTLIVQGLSNEFKKKGHDVKILTPTCAPSYKDEDVFTFEPRPLTFKEKTKILNGLNFFEKMFGYKELKSVQKDMVLEIEKIRPDVVHTFGAIQFGFVGTLSSARSFKWVHTIITQPPSGLSFIKKVMARRVFKRANLITVTAAEQVKDVKNKYGLDVDTTIKVGVDTTFFTPPSQLSQSKVVGAVSNFVWKDKVEGLLLLIRSFKKVLNDYPDATLKIAGEGDYRKLVEDTIKEHGLKANVELLGSMDRNKLRTFYQNISVFAHVSYQDTSPLTVLEAMASGLPIVASRIGDIPNIVSEEVGIVTDLKEESIVKALNKLLGSQELRKDYGKTARIKAQKEFSWSKVAEEYLIAYQDVISSDKMKRG